MRRLRRLVIAVLLGLLLYQGYVTGVLDESISQTKYALVRRALGAMAWNGGHSGVTVMVHASGERVYTWLWTHSSEEERAIIRRYRTLRDGSSLWPIEHVQAADTPRAVARKLQTAREEARHE